MHSIQILKDALFPPRCVFCRTSTNTGRYEAICESCMNECVPGSGFSCQDCGKRIPTINSLCHRSNFLLIPSGLYSNAHLESLIHGLKFDYIRSAALPLAHMMLQSLSSVLDEIPFDLSRALLVPIPLAKRREYERGFNQSALIAKEIHKLIPQLIYSPQILKRIRYEVPQSKTSTRKERERNMKNVFSANIPKTLNGLPLFLVDDVYTTGATIRSAVNELKKRGAGKIIVLVAART